MSIKLIDDAKLTAIGAAIRTKGGTAALIDVDDMPQAIADLPSGGGGFDFSAAKGISFYGKRQYGQDGGKLAGDVDLSSLDVSGFTDLCYMFATCTALTSLDVSGWDTSKVTDMSHMFEYCEGLTSLDLWSFDTSAVATMDYMFRYASNLTSVNLASLETTALTSTYSAFENASSIDAVIWSQKPTVQPWPHAFSYLSDNFKMYVPDDLWSAYRSATNYSSIAGKIYKISQLPAVYQELYAGHY